MPSQFVASLDHEASKVPQSFWGREDKRRTVALFLSSHMSQALTALGTGRGHVNTLMETGSLAALLHLQMDPSIQVTFRSWTNNVFLICSNS